MELNYYQERAAKFALPTATDEYMFLNLSAEAGELLSLRAKGIQDGYKFDYDQNVKKELGDILWHVANIALIHGFTLQDIAQSNLIKLHYRKEAGTIQGSGDER
jgi:NTP pyrophosphatase (non-canonical NTP hydrolase)